MTSSTQDQVNEKRGGEANQEEYISALAGSFTSHSTHFVKKITQQMITLTRNEAFGGVRLSALSTMSEEARRLMSSDNLPAPTGDNHQPLQACLVGSGRV